MELFELAEQRQVNKGIAHVEDLVLTNGSAGASQALTALVNLGKDPSTISVKWDGFPALVFGRDNNGQLVLMDKHMYGKVVKGKMSFSTIEAYDRDRGHDRSDLWAKERILRVALEKIVPKVANQFWMGDLLWAGKMTPQGDSYVFKPNTVEYRVKVNSGLGRQIAFSPAGGIAVHTFIPGLGQTDVPLVGLKGLAENGGITFLTGEIKNKPRVVVDPKLVQQVQQTIAKHKTAVDQMISRLTAMKGKSVLSAMSSFITQMLNDNDVHSNIVNRFLAYLNTKLSDAAKRTFLGENNSGWLYQPEGAAGLVGIWSMWLALAQLKASVKQQVDKQLSKSDVQPLINGTTAHEGYVFGSGSAKLKMIDRLSFSKANFAKHTVSDQEISKKKQMALAAFCFGRMNPPTLGHGLLMKKTVETGGKNSFIFLSNSHNAPDNPLDPSTKAEFIRQIYPQYSKFIVNDQVQSPVYAANWLYAKGFRNMAFVAGSDRLGDNSGSIEKILTGWNSGPVRTADSQFGPGGREHVNLTFVSSGDRDNDATAISGISGSLARKYAAAGKTAEFQRATGVKSTIVVNGKTLFQATRDGMDLLNNTGAPTSVKSAAKKQAKKALKEDRSWMNIEKEFQFHDQLNPALWENFELMPEVSKHLNQIARVFYKFLDLPELKIEDITISGSNAAFTYTPDSDIDLHLIARVRPEQQPFVRKYVDAKKNLFNEKHNITVNDQPVEVYVQFSDQPHTSAGVYSLRHNKWIEKPKVERAQINHIDVRSKLKYYIKQIRNVIAQKDLKEADRLMSRLSKYRKQGLSKTGEFGTANLVFKILRRYGYIDRLDQFRLRQQDWELSLEEELL